MQKTIIEQEKKYDILKNAAGDLLFIIKARLTNEEKPVIVYNGGDHALFYRNKENTIVLDYINPNVRQNLEKAFKVLIVEAQGTSIVREYFSDVKYLKELPLPELEVA